MCGRPRPGEVVGSSADRGHRVHFRTILGRTSHNKSGGKIFQPVVSGEEVQARFGEVFSELVSGRFVILVDLELRSFNNQHGDPGCVFANANVLKMIPVPLNSTGTIRSHNSCGIWSFLWLGFPTNV